MKTTSILMLILMILVNSCQRHSGIPLNALDVFNTENLPSTRFEIRGDADTLVTGSSGTKIFISKGTFIDSNGQPYSGPVDLELKEAIDPVDMVLGNMLTLSDGNILQSGGMIYLDARHDDQQLAIGTGKTIGVAVPAAMKSDSMKIYSSTFDSTSRQFNWINPEDRMIKIVKTDSLVPGESQALLKNNTVKERASDPEPVVPPSKPDQFSSGDTIMTLIFDTAAFPEFSQYRNVQFKLLAGTDGNLKDADSVWHKMQMDKTDQEGIYIFTFTRFGENDNIVQKYKVSPVFSGTDYELAMDEYNKKFASYEQKKMEIEEKRIEAERQQRLAMEQQRLDQEKALEESRQRQLALRNGAFNNFAEDPSANYIFTLNKLGWANIDRLYKSPAAKQVDMETIITDEESYESIYISLLFDKEKIYIPGYQKKDRSFGFTHGDYEKTVLPVGASAVLMATAYKDGELHFVTKRIKITDKMNFVLDPMPTEKEELKKILLKNIQS